MTDRYNFPEFFLGLDLGQLADYTALSIAQVHHEDVEIVPGLELKRLLVYDIRASAALATQHALHANLRRFESAYGPARDCILSEKIIARCNGRWRCGV